MHNPFDHLAKKVGKEALDPSGLTVVQYEISRDAQHADLRHDPDPKRKAMRAKLGLLGRIAAVLCLIDVFGHSLGGAELRACMSKHFAHRDECVNKLRAVLADAIADLAALPADAHERSVAEAILLHLQHRLRKKPSRTPAEEEFIVSMQST
jgi:hypothetical protein